MKRAAAQDVLIVVTAGATSRVAGESYVVRFQTNVPLRALAQIVGSAARVAALLDTPERPPTRRGRPAGPERTTVKRGRPANPEKARAREAAAAAEAERRSARETRAAEKARKVTDRARARVAAKEAREAEKARKAEVRAGQARTRAAVAEAREAKKQRREWIKGTPVAGDAVEYQEKPHGRWHVGRVVLVAADHFKIVGDRGTRHYPGTQVKRTFKLAHSKRS